MKKKNYYFNWIRPYSILKIIGKKKNEKKREIIIKREFDE